MILMYRTCNVFVPYHWGQNGITLGGGGGGLSMYKNYSKGSVDHMITKYLNTDRS